MRKVYLSFLGKSDYTPTVYRLNGVCSSKTAFVQAAQMEILGAGAFDLAFIVATPGAYRTNYGKLRAELKRHGFTKISRLKIDESMTAKGQWRCFEEILRRIESNDQLTVDMTHGFRSTPIVFSAAINFLQKARNVSLQAAYYGAFEKKDVKGCAPIIDMKDFYIVNEWAEAISRLVEDANARKIANVAAGSPGFQTGGLNDPELIQALEDLTDTIRNVDVNRVAAQARKALELIEAKRAGSSETGRVLLDLMVDKFSMLAVEDPQRYDHAYFILQLEIARLLLEHRLYMQAYTVMREFVGSIGMIQVQKGGLTSSEGRSRRQIYSSLFVNMIQFEEDKWKFPEEVQGSVDKIMPFYNKLRAVGVEALLRGFVSELVSYRNGFDHAWTSKGPAPSDISKKGVDMLKLLEQSVQLLKNAGLL